MNCKKLLSVILSLVMTLSVCVVAFNTTKLEADATSAGTYYWKVMVASDNDTGGWDNYDWTFYGKSSNGTGSETKIQTKSEKINYDTGGTSESKATHTVLSTSGSYFPTKVTFYYKFGGGVTHRKMDAYMYLYVSANNSSWTLIGSAKMYSYEWGTNKGTKTLTVATSNYPYASSMAISGGSTELTAPNYDSTSVNYTSAFSATPKDQYGVTLGTTVSWTKNTISNTTTYLSATSGDSSKFGVSKFTSASAKQTGTITAKATFNSKTCSASKSITVYPQYKILWNGGGGTLSGTSTQYYTNKGTSSTITYTIPSGFSATRRGYTFQGFNTSSGQTSGKKAGSTISISSISQTLYAAWTINSYNVTFYDSKIVLDENYNVYYKSDTKTTLQSSSWNYQAYPYYTKGTPTLSEADYAAIKAVHDDDAQHYTDRVFLGWTTTENYVHGTSPLYRGGVSNDKVLPQMDITAQTYYAVYGSTVQEYEVAFEYTVYDEETGELSTESVTTNQLYGTQITAPGVDGFVDDGYHYTFKGWSTARDGSGTTIYQNGNFPLVTSNIKFYVLFEKVAHSYTIPGEIEEDSTCCLEGKQEYFCDIDGCTHSTTKSIDRIDHAYTGTEGKEPTCTEAGREPGSECTMCGKVLTGATIAALGHDAIEVPAVEPTCTETGLTAGKVCSRCGEVLVAQKVVAASHSWEVIAAVPATCTTEGSTRGKVCSICGYYLVEPQVIEVIDHRAKTIQAVSPTCTETGLTAGSECAVCGLVLVEQEVVPALGHTETAVEEVPATCSSKGTAAGTVCSVCGIVISGCEEIASLEHNVTVYPAKAATCTEDGYTESQYCEDCGEWVVTSKTIAAHHTIVTVASVASTCLETGLTAGKVCSVCGEVIVAQQETAKSDHKSTTVKGTAATCTTSGLTAGKECSVCGIVLEAQEYIPATGHSPMVYAAIPATCSTYGFTESARCTECGELLYGEEIPQTDHTPVIVPGTEPTCTVDGVSDSSYCAICGITLTKGKTLKAGHTAVSLPAKAATCTETGLTVGKQCSVCGEILQAQNTVPMKDHKSVTDAAVAPTCTATGLTKGSHCKVCGEILVAQQTVPALGHGETYDACINEVASTCCVRGGYDNVTICYVCGEIVTSEHIMYDINPENHTGQQNDRYCADCGYFVSSGYPEFDEYYLEEEHTFISVIKHIFWSIKLFFISLREG